MYYSYVEIEYVATSFSPARTDLAIKLLKVNAEKSTFCALEIEYLGCVLTRDGIKPQSNKVQAILMIQSPTNVKQALEVIF